MNRERMQAQLVLHEGLRTKSYLDTEGYWTVGVGYNVSTRGVEFLHFATGRRFPAAASAIRMTEAEAMQVLDCDITRVENCLFNTWPYYTKLSPIRQRVALDLAFNLGHKAEHFVNTIAAAEREDWLGVAKHLYASKWAHQVDDGEGGHFGRADRLVRMVITDEDYTQ